MSERHTTRAVREPPLQQSAMSVVEIVVEEHAQLNRRYNRFVHNRRSVRLKGYDYTKPGAYFVTVVTRDRKSWFGDVLDGEMQLNDMGQLVTNAWESIATQYSYVKPDAYILMPNHLHGIIVTTEQDTDHTKKSGPPRKPLGRLIGAFKTMSTNRVNLNQSTPGWTLWQRGFYDHVIRNDRERDRVREYIVHNPKTWESDLENPYAVKKDFDLPPNAQRGQPS